MAVVQLINTYAEYVIRVHGPGSMVILMIILHIQSQTIRLKCDVPGQLS